jgi:hypothetical protein
MKHSRENLQLTMLEHWFNLIFEFAMFYGPMQYAWEMSKPYSENFSSGDFTFDLMQSIFFAMFG